MNTIEKAKQNALKGIKKEERSGRREIAHGCAILAIIFIIVPGIVGAVEMERPVRYMLWCIPWLSLVFILGEMENWFIGSDEE